MGLLNSLRAEPRRRTGYGIAGVGGVMGAGFSAASLSNLTASWQVNPGAINRWLRYELRTLRARARQLARSDAYARKFLTQCVYNIAGPQPFTLQSRVVDANGNSKDKTNNAIEDAYDLWGRPGNCEVTGKLSKSELDRLAVRCLARDGEILLRWVQTAGTGYLLQFIDIDRLDEQRNEALPGGGAIKMGVEVDNVNRPVAYWILTQHPGELGEWTQDGTTRKYERVPANQIYHKFIPDWPEQVRGFPWMHAAMVRLHHLGLFEEAALINARVGANKVAILQTPNGEMPENLATGKDSAGNLLEDSRPGQYWTLPEGVQISSFNPAFPDAAVDPFVRSLLRGTAAALGVAYHGIAQDPERVNYSTARVALLEERDMWVSVQDWYIDHVKMPTFGDWLRTAVLENGWPSAYADAVNTAKFVAKTWKWIDPQKESAADASEIGLRLTSRTRLAAERGDDIQDIFEEIAQEEALAKAKGIELPAIQANNPAKAAPTGGGSSASQPAEGDGGSNN